MLKIQRILNGEMTHLVPFCSIFNWYIPWDRPRFAIYLRVHDSIQTDLSSEYEGSAVTPFSEMQTIPVVDIKLNGVFIIFLSLFLHYTVSELCDQKTKRLCYKRETPCVVAQSPS